MKILEINSHLSGSTGKIMMDTAEQARYEGYEVYTSSAVHRKEETVKSDFHIYIGSVVEKKIHNLLRKYTGYNGVYSSVGTMIFLNRIKKIKPDIIHIHNIHSCYINMRFLFSYINEHKIPVVWTLHDCWTFTGHCTYFDMIGCDGWKSNRCTFCEHNDEYPVTKCNKVAQMYNLKERLFTSGSVKRIITPSQWLANLTRESFWKNTPVEVIYNGINQNIFKPTENDIRDKHKIGGKFIVLGVASPWNERKSPETFVRLSHDLDKKIYQIIIIGSDGREFESGDGIICIPRTSNHFELAKYYSAADVLVNPTFEDNFPTVNIEALSCGTPVITYQTGGSAECLNDKCGIAVERGNYEKLIEAILHAYNEPFLKSNCINQSKLFSRENQVKQYVEIYKSILG